MSSDKEREMNTVYSPTPALRSPETPAGGFVFLGAHARWRRVLACCLRGEAQLRERDPPVDQHPCTEEEGPVAIPGLGDLKHMTLPSESNLLRQRLPPPGVPGQSAPILECPATEPLQPPQAHRRRGPVKPVKPDLWQGEAP